MDKYGIDGHKLMYHPKEVAKWLEGEPFYPIYIEISPSNGCNHRCKFCSFDFTGYKSELLDYKLFEENVPIMAKGGVKAVMFAGEGEPLIHPRFVDIVKMFDRNGIDTALTTNGALLNEDVIDGILPCMNWIKISLDAGTDKTHSYLHGCKEGEFDIILNNLKYALRLREEKGYTCTLGVQVVLFDENKDELKDLAIKLRDTGADYLVIKPFTDHQYRSNLELGVNYKDYYEKLTKQLRPYSDNTFPIIMRENTFKDLECDRSYNVCHALDFWSYIDSYGNVYACSNFLGNKDYVYGNLYENNFGNIWINRKRPDIDITDCRKICRMDKINQYLEDFNDKPDGVNFI